MAGSSERRHRPQIEVDVLRNLLRPLCGLVMLCAFAASLPTAASAQSEAATDEIAEDTAAIPGGFRLLYGPTFAGPILDDQAFSPFAAVGDFRPGFGIRVGAGYRFGPLELNGTVDYSGIEAGEPIEENGIGMGRATAILRAYGLDLRWAVPAGSVYGWVPMLSGGYVQGGVDNLLVAPSELPAELAGFAAEVQDDNGEEPTGISGRGFRVGAAVERGFGSNLAARVQLEGDFLTYDEFTFDRVRFDWDGGSGWSPRLAVLLRWAP